MNRCCIFLHKESKWLQKPEAWIADMLAVLRGQILQSMSAWCEETEECSVLPQAAIRLEAYISWEKVSCCPWEVCLEPYYQIRSIELPCVLLSRRANCIYLLSLACSVSQAEREALAIHEYFTSSIYMKAKPCTAQVRRLGIEKEGRKRHWEVASRQEISLYLFFFSFSLVPFRQWVSQVMLSSIQISLEGFKRSSGLESA